jgi:hypothetical protein
MSDAHKVKLPAVAGVFVVLTVAGVVGTGHVLGSSRPGWRVPSADLLKECERLLAIGPKPPATAVQS